MTVTSVIMAYATCNSAFSILKVCTELRKDNIDSTVLYLLSFMYCIIVHTFLLIRRICCVSSDVYQRTEKRFGVGRKTAFGISDSGKLSFRPIPVV